MGKLSQKIDTLSRSLDDTKELIKLETQKAAYIRYEQDIHYGYSQLQVCIDELDNVTCSGTIDCKRKKELIAERYTTDSDVRGSMDAIFDVVTSDSTFHYNMLSLLKQESKCNIPKINLFINKLVALITKGMIVSIFHDLLTKPNYDFTDDEVLGSNMLHTLESKRRDVQKSCFKNFDYWIARDVEDAHTLFTSDITTSNTNLLNHLKRKCPWIIWHVLTYSGKTEPQAGPLNSLHRRMISSSKTLNVHSFAIPAVNAEVEEYSDKTERWKEVIRKRKFGEVKQGVMTLDNDAVELDKMIGNEIVLSGQVQSFVILPANKTISGYYKDEIKQRSFESLAAFDSPFNVLIYKPSSNRDILVASSLKTVNDNSCNNFCKHNGECILFPYSTNRECLCKKGFSGAMCETREDNQRLKQVVTFLLKKTFSLPTFASIQHAIEDVQLYLKISSENIQESIIKLGEKMGEFMSNRFNWLEIVLKYRDSIDKLYYFHSISSEKLVYHQANFNANITDVNTTSDKSRFSMLEEHDISKYLLSPMGIQKWLYDINFLIVGRNDSQFNIHKPVIFMSMDRYRTHACDNNYKDRLTGEYRQFMLLQLKGYVLWSNAYSADDRDSTVIANRYLQVVESQEKFLQKETCNVTIPNSKNLQNCSGGYFIHRSLDVSVVCEDGYFLKGKCACL